MDNLPPGLPQGLAADLASGDMMVTWRRNGEPDLSFYRVYSGTSPTFVPSPSNRLAEQSDTAYVDATWEPEAAIWYKVSAVDINENEGPHSTVAAPNVVATFLAGFDVAITEYDVVVTWMLTEARDDLEFLVHRINKHSGQSEITARIEADGRGQYQYRDVAYEPGSTYIYRVEVEQDGTHWVLFETGPVVAPLPPLALQQNVPNPFNPNTRIDFSLPQRGHTHIRVYDVTGRLVATLVDRVMRRGPHSVDWNGRDDSQRALPSGVYFYELSWAGDRTTRKMLMVR